MSQHTLVEEAIIAGVNRAREASGIPQLSHSPVLSTAARAYSRRMAELAFFSHTSPEAGLESPSSRVAAAGGAFRAVGENIAVLGREQAAAADFVQGWLASKGHRENLMTPDWEQTGVGVFEHNNGQTFATQLFGIPHSIILESPSLSAEPADWDVLRVTAKIGRGYSLAAFVSNKFTSSVDAAEDGTMELDVEIPRSRRSHVSFGRKKRRGDDGWISVYDGFIDTSADSSNEWSPSGPAHSGCSILDVTLLRFSGSELIAEVRGVTKVDAVCILDGQQVEAYTPGQAFQQRLRFRAGTGSKKIEIGIPEKDGMYLVYARYVLDTDSATLSST